MARFLVALALVTSLALSACGAEVTSTPDIEATVQAAIGAAVPTSMPSPTPDIQATIASGIQATQEALPSLIPTASPIPRPTPVALPTPISTPVSAPPTPKLAPPTQEPISLYAEPRGLWLIEYPSGWEVRVGELDLGIEFTHFNQPESIDTSVKVKRRPGIGCLFGLETLTRDKLQSTQDIYKKQNSDFRLVSANATTIAGFPASEVEYYDSQFTAATELHLIDFYLVIGKDVYEIRGQALFFLSDSTNEWAKLKPLIKEIIYSFRLGPFADTSPVPPEPLNSRFEFLKSETILLSNGAKLFQGKVRNNDTYWSVADIEITLTLRDADDRVVWDQKVNPRKVKLVPGDEARYEILVTPDVTGYETSQISRSWVWTCD